MKQFSMFFAACVLTAGLERPSLHAKCLIIDRREALITSANFTEAAQQRNVEVGVVIRHEPLAERSASYFEGVRVSDRFQRCI